MHSGGLYSGEGTDSTRKQPDSSTGEEVEVLHPHQPISVTNWLSVLFAQVPSWLVCFDLRVIKSALSPSMSAAGDGSSSTITPAKPDFALLTKVKVTESEVMLP